MLVYDITDRVSFDQTRSWMKNIKSVSPGRRFFGQCHPFPTVSTTMLARHRGLAQLVVSLDASLISIIPACGILGRLAVRR